MWNYRGQQRPDFALAPAPGQESVWDYPRPPRLERAAGRVQVWTAPPGPERSLLADSTRACRVLETASPPTYYLPPDDVTMALLRAVPGHSYCEWKGEASYLVLATGDATRQPVAWTYPQPTAAFATLAGWVAFYPGRVHCEVDGEVVRPQPGGFYAGWVTDAIVGPFKGEPGTGHW
jgi:uncharacterized protein (DUF427 family)